MPMNERHRDDFDASIIILAQLRNQLSHERVQSVGFLRRTKGGGGESIDDRSRSCVLTRTLASYPENQFRIGRGRRKGEKRREAAVKSGRGREREGGSEREEDVDGRKYCREHLPVSFYELQSGSLCLLCFFDFTL